MSPGAHWLFEDAGFLFLFQPVGLALDVDREAVMEEPVDDGGGDARISEDLAPLAEAAITRQDHRPPFIMTRDELEEEMGGEEAAGSTTR